MIIISRGREEHAPSFITRTRTQNARAHAQLCSNRTGTKDFFNY